jgi:uncharacterized protein
MHATLRKNAAMSFAPPPPSATWHHEEARTGFEVVYFTQVRDSHHIEGWTTAVEDGHPWLVEYQIDVGDDWVTRSARVGNRTVDGTRATTLEADEYGRWRVNGIPAPKLDGCLDVDLESSAMTNAFPAHRLGLEVGERLSAPAAYVRALDLSVERLEQTYERLPDEEGREVYDYESPTFDFRCRLTYDDSGLVVKYPGIAVRTS